eukprot:COSAG03_NODE_1623_length_3757_cov_9.235375_4_plen_143_part_00
MLASSPACSEAAPLAVLSHAHRCPQGTTSHAGTYNGQAINIAAAIATIETLSQPGIYARALAHGEALREAIVSSARRHGLKACTTGVGTMFSVHLGLSEPPTNYRQLEAADEQLYEKFRAAMFGTKLFPTKIPRLHSLHLPS